MGAGFRGLWDRSDPLIKEKTPIKRHDLRVRENHNHPSIMVNAFRLLLPFYRTLGVYDLSQYCKHSLSFLQGIRLLSKYGHIYLKKCTRGVLSSLI